MNSIFRNIRLLPAVAVLLFASCNNILETPVEFDVTLEPDTAMSYNDEGVVVIPVGTSLTFDFLGNADFISFNYEIFNETTTALNFDTKLSWNSDENHSLNLFLSTQFTGLGKVDSKADSALIQGHTWIDASDMCIWPAARNGVESSTLDLTAYRGQHIVLAFRYKTVDNAGFQPMFTISGLNMKSVVKKTGDVASVVAVGAMAFQPFDMLNLTPDSVAYESAKTAGVWDVSFSDTGDPTAMIIRQTPAGRDLNEDWLISRPIEVLRGKTTVGNAIPVKNISTEVTAYTHTFTDYGEYTITFKAANANYKYQSATEKTMTIIVTQ